MLPQREQAGPERKGESKRMNRRTKTRRRMKKRVEAPENEDGLSFLFGSSENKKKTSAAALFFSPPRPIYRDFTESRGTSRFSINV